MRCPRCQHNNSRVIDSRQADDGRAIRRRRECENCSFRFAMQEVRQNEMSQMST